MQGLPEGTEEYKFAARAEADVMNTAATPHLEHDHFITKGILIKLLALASLS